MAGLAIGIVLAGSMDPAHGESGTVHNVSGAGLRMRIDTRWVNGQGYRPVKIDVVPSRSTGDRTLTVEFVVEGYWAGSRRRDRVVQDIEVPAGSGLVQTTISVPQTTAWNWYQVNVLEDGELLQPLSPRGGAGSPYRNSAWEEAFPAILAIGATPPDTAEMAKLYPAAENYQYYRGNTSPRQSLLPTTLTRAPSELPKRWIDYTNLDIVCLSLDQFDELASRRPKAFRAIVEWTAAGGNLLVCGIGGNWHRLEELESLVGLGPAETRVQPDPSAQGWSIPDRSTRGWRPPDRKRYGKPLQGMGTREQDSAGTYGIAYDGTPAEKTEPQAKPGPPPDEPPFVFREFQQGMIVAMAAGDPFPSTKDEWGWLLATLGSERVLWYQRHGVSAIRTNPDFWKFLIPGVGLAPVIGFRVLITLFVVVIGPLNYILLRRLKRLHLLLLTTPLSAAAVTLVLFGYAVVADGLGTRVRVRSVTHIDQRRGHAVCWARLSYYAGLAPARGLSFPGDVAVTPLAPAHGLRSPPAGARVGGRPAAGLRLAPVADADAIDYGPLAACTVRTDAQRIGRPCRQACN